jgi:hypothetical protein
MSTEITSGRDNRASAMDRALRRIVAEIVDGLRHGYFEFSLTCDVIPHGRRRLVLHAGKSYQFVLAAEDCTWAETSGNPRHADAFDGLRETERAPSATWNGR